MKMHLCLFVLLITANILSAQNYSKCSYHYFKGGKVSSSQCYDTNERWGKAKAYNAAGGLIYEKELRKIGGHSSVEFTYYSNGAVEKARWSSAPDGGIQWYSSVTTFSDDGVVTGLTDNNYDHGPATTPTYIQQKPREKKTDSSHTAYCAVIYSSEFWYINKTGRELAVTAQKTKEQITVVAKPGIAVKGGVVVLAEQFEDPAKTYRFAATGTGKKKHGIYIVKPSAALPKQQSKEVRRYYFDVLKK